MLSVRQLEHNGLIVSNLDKSIAFYRDILGLKIIDRPDFWFPGAWLQAGEATIHLIAHREDTDRAGLPRAPGTTAGGRSFHIAFEVDDCHAAEKWLSEKEIPIARGAKPRPDGAIQLYLFDPDNHVIELFSGP